MRVILFIDGSNFYRNLKNIGLLPNKLSYDKLSKKLVGTDEWVETRFYIGQLKQKGNLSLYDGQRRFLDRLRHEHVSIFLGRMEEHPAKGAAQELNRWLDEIPKRSDIPELSEQIIGELRQIAESEKTQWVEKAVDVMIATDMVSMAYEKKYDAAYLLSSDGDFVPAIEKVRDTGCKVFAASPAMGHQISQVADTFTLLKHKFFRGCWRRKHPAAL